MEKQFKELEAKLLVLKNLVEIAYSYVNQAQDRSRDFAVFCSIFEVIKNNTDNIWEIMSKSMTNIRVVRFCLILTIDKNLSTIDLVVPFHKTANI